MPRILDRLPIPTQDDVALVRGEMARVRAYEIIVWVSLAAENVLGGDPVLPRFPAILDTGHNHNFSIREDHLVRWTGVRPGLLRPRGNIRQDGRRVPLYEADLWLHRNRPGSRDDLLDRPPHLVELTRGIAVYPSGSSFPRLPLLGLRAILSNKLRLVVDGARESAWLRTAAPWWWPFG